MIMFFHSGLKLKRAIRHLYLINKQVLQFSVRTDVKSIVNGESNNKTRF